METQVRFSVIYPNRHTSGNFLETLKIGWICALPLFWCKFFSSFAEFSNDDYDEFQICDDSKRVPVKGNNRTYHVDCDGYDINGTLILTGIDYCYLDESDPRAYRQMFLYPSYQFRYDLNDDLLTTVACIDFFHCSYCNKCKPFNFSSVMVSIKFSFHFFINLNTVRQEQSNWYSNVFVAKSKDNPSWLWW